MKKIIMLTIVFLLVYNCKKPESPVKMSTTSLDNGILDIVCNYDDKGKDGLFTLREFQESDDQSKANKVNELNKNSRWKFLSILIPSSVLKMRGYQDIIFYFSPNGKVFTVNYSIANPAISHSGDWKLLKDSLLIKMKYYRDDIGFSSFKISDYYFETDYSILTLNFMLEEMEGVAQDSSISGNPCKNSDKNKFVGEFFFHYWGNFLLDKDDSFADFRDDFKKFCQTHDCS